MITLRPPIAWSTALVPGRIPWPGSGRTIEALAALATGTLAIILGLLPRRSSPVPLSPTPPESVQPESHRYGRPTARKVATATLCALAAGLLATGPVAIVIFAGCGFASGYVLAGRSAAAKAAGKAELRLAAAPLAIELFAAGLGSGLLPEQAASTVVEAFGRAGPEREMDPIGQVAERFREVAAILADTADPTLAWTALCKDPATEAVGTAALRSSRTGAPLAEAVARAAHSARVTAQQAAQGQVRAVAVKATAPLALCFLPAFVLIGILPTALGLLHEFQP
jgi:hypothetical protein